MKVTVIIKVTLTLVLGVARGSLESQSLFNGIYRLLHTEQESAENKNSRQVQTGWIKQKLDHFNETDNKRWNMRYMANEEFYQPGGPLFIFVGAEWAVTPTYITSGHMYDMAREHNAYLFYTEHRYYGQSKPTSDISNENIKYLTIHQALADLAHFVRTMKTIKPGMAKSKVILAGGSYAASMVTWFRKLYPDLATGCWASTAILWGKVDFHEYKEIVGESLRMLDGDACYERIKNGIAGLEHMFNSQRGEEVKTLLKLCSNFNATNNLDVWLLFSQFSDDISHVVQYNDAGDTEHVCSRIMVGNDDFNGLVDFWRSLIHTRCIDMTYKSNILENLCQPSYNDYMKRQWFYHACNEFGWFQHSGSGKHPFGTKFPLELYYQMCADCFGAKYTKEFIHQQIKASNAVFGGLNPNVTNVFYTYGQYDPWTAVGIQDIALATTVSNYAHVKDFASIGPNDSLEMRASKEKIAQLVREWLSAEDE